MLPSRLNSAAAIETPSPFIDSKKVITYMDFLKSYRSVSFLVLFLFG